MSQQKPLTQNNAAPESAAESSRSVTMKRKDFEGELRKLQDETRAHANLG